jgi:autotransporter-associated beta strand protein
MVIGPSLSFAQRPLGIDVSSFQGGSVNWASVKGAGYIFAWAKATEGATVNDADYTVNANNGKAAGVIMGAYHYAHPELNSPSTEASHFWSIAGSKITADGLTLMPMLDIEGSALPNGHVGAASLSDWVNNWCIDVVQSAANAGVSIKPVIYVSAGTGACDLDSTVGQWFADIANYGSVNGNNDPQSATGPWTCCTSCERWGAGGWQFWQYESVGTVPGISGNVDHDVFNGTGAGLTNTMIAIASTNSTIYYWDPQGTTGGNPYTGSMSGTWENNKWSYGATGLGSPVGWVEGKAALFGVHTGTGTPPYTVTMNANHVVAGFFDGPLTPNSCDVTIQGSGTVQLANGPQGMDSINASDGSLGLLRIHVNISGDGQLFPEGNGQSFLHGTNSYTGGTTLGYTTVNFSGTVNFNNGFAFGTGPITLWNHGNNGTLNLEGTAAATVTNPVSVTTAVTNNIIGNTNGLTFSGDWSLGANLLTLGGGSTAGKQTIISGVVSGSAGLTVFNSGTIVLSGVNTYTGTTTINSPAVFAISGAGQLGSGSHAGNIVIGGTFNYNSSASQTLSGTLSGAGPLRVSNSGTLILTHANTYTGGTTVSNGATLCLSSDSALGGSTAGLTLNNGCLKNNGTSLTITSSRTITLGSQGGYIDAGWAPSSPVTLNSRLSGTGALLINLDGSPVVLANTTNSYNGNTIIGTNGPGYFASGTQALLKLGASGVIPNGSGKGSVIINQAWFGVLDLAGFSQTINGLSGDGIVDNSSGNGSLTVGSNNVTSTFSGIIQDSVGTLSLTKVGAGTFTLAGANTYTGNTTISGGTLALGASGSISSTPLIAIAAGGNLDVSAISAFSLSGGTALSANGTASPSVIKGGTTVDLGSQPITLAYDGSHPALTISQGALSLNGNAITVNVNGSPLPLGTYTIIQQTSGNVTASGAFTVSGTVIGVGKTAAISVVDGNVNLIISEPSAFSNLTAAPSAIYGAATVTLNGTVSGTGPAYPANGETVTVTINDHQQNTTINDSTGDFSINYPVSNLSVSGSPYQVAYSYGGNASLNPSSEFSTVLTINPRPVVLGGARTYDTTATADFSILSISNIVGADIVTVASGTGTLASASAGIEPVASFGTLALGGASATNYTLLGASGSVLINPLPVILGGARTYDGTATADFSILSASNILNGDIVTVASGTGALAAADAGIEPVASFGTLALGGASASNYTLLSATGSVTINPLSLIVAGTRGYDATSNADFSILSISNIIGTDAVSVASGTGTLAAANVGLQSIASFGTLALGGASFNNYTFTGATGSVTITPAFFSITSQIIDDTGTNFVLTWQSAPGITYQVISSADVAAPLTTWTDVGSPITATSTSTSSTNPIIQPLGFFNVKSPQ